MNAPRRKSAYKKQIWWQIILPMVFFFLLAIFAGASISRGGATAQWADLSLIWLILPWLVIFLVFLILLGALIYGLARLLNLLPRYTRLAQTYADMLAEKTRVAADKAAAPIFFTQKAKAGLRALLNPSSQRNAHDE